MNGVFANQSQHQTLMATVQHHCACQVSEALPRDSWLIGDWCQLTRNWEISPEAEPPRSRCLLLQTRPTGQQQAAVDRATRWGKGPCPVAPHHDGQSQLLQDSG